MTASIEATLKLLGRLAGTWTTVATHPQMPGVIVHGSVFVEWLEGDRFLIMRARTDHPDFPDSVSVIGFMGSDRVEPGERKTAAADDDKHLLMHYFDSRGVFRIYEMSMDESSWRLWRNAPGFSQRFTGAISGDAKDIDGLWQLSRDDNEWRDDLKITYHRTSGSNS